MIPSGYSRNVIAGTLPGGEIFQMSMWCDEAPSDEAATQAQADNFAGEINTAAALAGSPKGFLASGGAYSTLTTYSYLDNTGKASFSAQSPIVGMGGAATQTLPDQCTLVVTLLTGFAGRRNRGRMYLPYQAGTMTNGQAVQANIDPLALWWSNLIHAWNSHIGTQHVVVLSQVAGASHSVNAVQIDSKIDIQRRRADKLVPIYKKLQIVT